MSKKRVYLFVTLAMVAGYLWVIFNMVSPYEAKTPNLCLFKRVTGVPCPSCGCTHAVVRLAHMDLAGAADANPLGFVIMAALLVIPVWLLYDLTFRKSSFYNFYTKFESSMRKPWVAVPLMLVLIANWAWNIYKYKA